MVPLWLKECNTNTAARFCHLIDDCLFAYVVNPGFGGQKFIQSQVSKIKKLRELCNERGVDPWIEVDGGVSGANAGQVNQTPESSCKP